MRVVVVAEQLRRRVPGGIGTYVRGLAQGLRAIEPDQVAFTLWASRAVGDGSDPIGALGRSATSALPSLVLVRAWSLGLRGPPGSPEVLHATSLAVPPPGRAKLSVMVHDLAWRHVPEAFPARGRRWHDRALQRSLRRASLLMAPSKLTADDLVTAGAPVHQVEVVEEGCDHLPPPDHASAALLLERLSVGDEYLLTVSTLEPRKNLGRLVAAYQEARERSPIKWPLVIVGPTGWAKSSIGLPPPGSVPGVVMAGSVPDAVLSALYSKAQAVVYVPLWEGFGLPVLEAMNAGTPVVASPVPSAGGAVLEVDPSDVGSLARGLLRVATDAALRDELVEAGRKRARELTWERAARRHVELWEALLQAHA